MPRTHRGKALWVLPGRGRGRCPICGRTGVKLLYGRIVKSETLDVCKRCRNKDNARTPR